MNPKISIILPVYNAERYIADTLDSVISGSFSDFEVVAVNDGSTDSSLRILTSYAERDGRIRVIDKPNTGVSDTRNVAIAEAKGEYLAFLDSDDIYSPEYLERMYSAAEKSGADVTVCGYVTFRGEKPVFPDCENGEIRTTDIRELLDTGLMTSMCIKLSRRDFVVENGIVFEDVQKYSEDLFFSWKICAISNSVCIIDNKLYGYRLTGHGATSKCYEGLYSQYKSAFEDIRVFLDEHDANREEHNLNISFTRGLPAFLLMIARQKSSLRSKIKEIRKILQDETIEAVLSGDVKEVAANKRDEKMYLNAKKHHVHRLLWHGYYMHLRSRLAAVLKR